MMMIISIIMIFIIFIVIIIGSIWDRSTISSIVIRSRSVMSSGILISNSRCSYSNNMWLQYLMNWQ